MKAEYWVLVVMATVVGGILPWRAIYHAAFRQNSDLLTWWIFPTMIGSELWLAAVAGAAGSGTLFRAWVLSGLAYAAFTLAALWWALIKFDSPDTDICRDT